MSFKSGISSSYPFSEIIEKSYSVRSPSIDSLSNVDDDEALAHELLHKMSAGIISKLRKCFVACKPGARNTIDDLDRRVDEAMRDAANQVGVQFESRMPKRRTLWIDKDTFLSSIDKIFGNHRYCTHAEKLFHILDPFHTGRVWWSDLLEKLVQHGSKRTMSRTEGWTPINEATIKFIENPHAKKETIVKIVTIETESTFCYVSVSKGGRVGIYSGKLTLLAEYNIFYARTGVSRRVKNTWVTDLVYMKDIKALAICASDRSMIIYEASTLSHHPIYLISGMPNIPTCFCYIPAVQKTDLPELLIGEERGRITSIIFKQPKYSMFHKKHPDKINTYFWTEVLTTPHDVYCSITIWKRVHTRSVRRILHCTRSDVVVSCSHDSERTVVIRARHGKLPDYVFHILRGVHCIRLSPNLRIIATGGGDGVRLWDPSVTGRPLAVLRGGPVVDLTLVVHLEVLISVNKACVVDVWDIFEERCLQTVKLSFPFIGVLGKKVEFGTASLYPGPPRKHFSASVQDPKLSGRRPSNVYLSDVGGLKLDSTDSDSDHYNFGADEDKDLLEWKKYEFLVTCCNFICVVKFSQRPLEGGQNAQGDRLPSPLPPPDKTTQARRPSIWDNLELTAAIVPLLSSTRSGKADKSLVLPDVPTVAPQTALLSPTFPHQSLWSESPHDNLDELLKQAGLEGILDKDFALMLGLKQDLNQRLEELRVKEKKMKIPVSLGAPYIALDLYEAEEIKFSGPLPISERMRKKSGLQSFTDPAIFLSRASLFSLTTPRSSRSSISRTSSSDFRQNSQRSLLNF